MNKIQQQAAALNHWVGGKAITFTSLQNVKDIAFAYRPPMHYSECDYAELSAMVTTNNIILNMMGK